MYKVIFYLFLSGASLSAYVNSFYREGHVVFSVYIYFIGITNRNWVFSSVFSLASRLLVCVLCISLLTDLSKKPHLCKKPQTNLILKCVTSLEPILCRCRRTEGSWTRWRVASLLLASLLLPFRGGQGDLEITMGAVVLVQTKGPSNSAHSISKSGRVQIPRK